MILTHRHRTLEQTTLQILIDYELPDSASPEKVKAYSTQILQLLDVLGMFVARPPDFDHVAQELTRSLCSLGYILCETQSVGDLDSSSIITDKTECRHCRSYPSRTW